MSWNPEFAEGDSGVPVGHALKVWREIEDAERAKAGEPPKLRPKSLGHVQADVLKIAEDADNDASVRVEAYLLSWEMARYMAEADIDPLTNGT